MRGNLNGKLGDLFLSWRIISWGDVCPLHNLVSIESCSLETSRDQKKAHELNSKWYVKMNRKKNKEFSRKLKETLVRNYVSVHPSHDLRLFLFTGPIVQ